MYSVLLLIASFGALSGLYVLLDAPFVAVTQIIVYAGAIMVLFLFVVMLLNAPHEDAGRCDRVAPAAAARARCGSARCWRCVLVVELVWALSRDRRPSSARRRRPAPVSSVAAIGAALFTDYAFAFEVDLGPDPGRDGRRRRAGAARDAERALMPSLNHYLVLSAILFAIGTAGVFLRRNLITILLSIEIMLNAVNLTFVAVRPLRSAPSTARSSCSSS